jgi:hypothetical protein
VLVIERLAFEVFKEVECDLRFVCFEGFGDHREIAAETYGVDLVAHRLERGDHVKLGSPQLLLFLDSLRDHLRWYQVLRGEDENSKLCFRFEPHSGIRW